MIAVASGVGTLMVLHPSRRVVVLFVLCFVVKVRVWAGSVPVVEAPVQMRLWVSVFGLWVLRRRVRARLFAVCASPHPAPTFVQCIAFGPV